MSYIVVLFFAGYLIYLLTKQLKRNKPVTESSEGIDVKKPVENPELVKAIKDYKENPSEEKLPDLYSLINNAVYLAPVDMSEVDSESLDENKMIVKEDSIVGFSLLTAEDGGVYQPLFTDWKHIADFTKEKIDTMIFPAYDAWSFFFRKKNDLKGVVINPSSDDLFLSAGQIEVFLYKIKNNRCATEVVDLINSEFGNNSGEVNPELTILAVGNLTGLFMFLSFGFDLSEVEPGTVYLSNDANLLFPKVFACILKKLEDRGFPGGNLVPDENVHYESNLTYIEVIENLQKPLMELKEKYEFSDEEFIDVLEDIAAFVIQRLCEVLPLSKALGILLYGIVQGSKTVPCK